MQNGTMSVEYYAPIGTDPQTPHKQNELYVIASGKGTFCRNSERVSFQQGDVLFVPAGMEHRFENFSHDFATWVIFYGFEGVEAI
ncbi:MAG: cupin domain-containing protein [Chitinophagaceae bacterium]